MEEAELKGFYDDVTDGKMPRDPRTLLDRIIHLEEMEIPLYYELARGAPNEHLRRTIEYMIEEEKQDLEKMRMLYEYFQPYGGKAPLGYADPFLDAGPYHTWLERVKKAREIELYQCAMLCHLAIHSLYPHVHKIIIDLAGEQLRQAAFWNDMVIAFSGMAAGYPGGPGYGGAPGIYAEAEKKESQQGNRSS